MKISQWTTAQRNALTVTDSCIGYNLDTLKYDVLINGVWKQLADLSDIRSITTITTNTTLANQYTVLVDSTSGNITVTLPTAAANNGRVYNIKKIVAANSVIIDPNGSETIDGNTSLILVGQWENTTIQSNGSNWFIL